MEPEQISQDDLESLRFMISEQEKAQHAVQTFQMHISRKYGIQNGDKINVSKGGEIIR